MIDVIREHASIAEKDSLTEAQIKHAYCELIKDYFDVLEEDQQSEG